MLRRTWTCLLLMTALLISPQRGLATTVYGFLSPSTGFEGQVTIDDTDPSFVQGGTIAIGGAITDFVFTFDDNLGLNTYTPADTEVVPLSLQFSLSGVAPDDIIFVAGSYRDLAPPNGGNIRFEFGGINSGGSTATNGNFTGASTGILSFSDGTFIPEPATLSLLALGAVALLRRKASQDKR